ncbi:hypothetical protein DAPPUDRAFT_256104 [Daphnia pulex]|uniref:Uncharacterized protein n=1 Tax=Daphnia pulex TaxID=6669 RepID=E9HAR4_DAPPU|nr:hypothetical protein DAPPUDRAFT_256104 [Daphnia pulex]|eukprot:EFX71072.1 hypothetical protein DAPPUDRAFT_256104 [Daphnia pulex]
MIFYTCMKHADSRFLLPYPVSNFALLRSRRTLAVCAATQQFTHSVYRNRCRLCRLQLYALSHKLRKFLIAGVCYFRVNPLVLAIADLVSFVNNVIVIVLLSRVFVCKCCVSADSSVPVQLVVHNPPQPTPMWVIPPAGQQPQFQSYPTVVYSPYQQQPVPQQE